MTCYPSSTSLCWVCGLEKCPHEDVEFILPSVLLSKKKTRSFKPQLQNDNMNDYQEFIKRKTHLTGEFGFDPVYMPDMAFDFQRHIIEKAVRKGRMAVFADTGLGKTMMQLSIAINIVKKTNGKVLILTPLAVAFQFILEAEKMGIDDIEYSRDGVHTKNIVICNYERLHLFNSTDFKGVVLDESSILKNFKGAFKTAITAFMRKIEYRYLSTATPSPNDFIELGTSSEALGYMGYMDMLGKFFKNNQGNTNSNGKQHRSGEKYYLKPHAETDFFAWVNTWATMVKMPSDIGFSNEGYILPELKVHSHQVTNTSLITENGQVLLFAPTAKSINEVRFEQKQTIDSRCQKAVELAQGKTSVYWCNLNEESECLSRLDKDAVEIRGSMDIEKKEDILLNFANGNINRIITKAKMTGMGLNWQHCNHSVFFPSWSYEQYYQAIRRFWRFGQTREVNIDLVLSDGQSRVIDILQKKTQKAIQLYESLTSAVNKSYEDRHREFNQSVITPNFI